MNGKTRKFYTKNDYEYLARVGNTANNNDLSAKASTYKVTIPKQLRLEPWDLYNMDQLQRNAHGIQFEFVRPPFGREMGMDDEGWDDNEEFIGPHGDGEMSEDDEEVADNMHADVVQPRGNVRGRDDADLDHDLIHRQRGIRRQRNADIQVARHARPRARHNHPRRRPPLPPNNPPPVPAGSANRFANHTQGTRDRIRNARVPNPAARVAHLNGKRKGGD